MAHKILIGFLLIISFLPLSAQERWTAEFRPGVHFFTTAPHNAVARTGYGFDLSLGYHITPHLIGYSGWGWNSFQIEKFNRWKIIHIDHTGHTFGLRFIHPLPNTSLTYILGIGGTYTRLELEDPTGNQVADTGHNLGWEAEAGLGIDIGNKFRIRPQVRYRYFAGAADLQGTESNLQFGYINFGLGFARRF